TVAGETPVRRRLVGGALRRYRENLGYALEDAAKVLECDRSKISRIETGQRGIRPKELRELLTEYGVPEVEQQALVGLARRGGQGGWWDEYSDVVPEAVAEYFIMETVAAEVMTYEAQLVPDLLQTPDYARAIAAAAPGSDADDRADRLTAAKAARQDVTLGRAVRLSVVIGEAALRQVVGGPEVMAARLARLATDVPGITLQVLPFSAGAHAAGGSASLTILRFAEAPSLGVVYLEGLSGGVYLEGQTDIANYVRAFTLLRSSALTGTETARMLRETARSPSGGSRPLAVPDS